MVQMVIRSMLHGGTLDLFLVPGSATQLVHGMLSCLWDDAYKRTLAANQKE